MDSTVRVADLPASRGAAWIGESFRLFGAAPFAWIAMCCGWAGISFALVFVPVIGVPIATFLQPPFFASFAIAAYRQSSGEKLTAADLFLGFRRNLRSLVNLGAVLLLANLVIFAIMVALGLPLALRGQQEITINEYADQVRDNIWIIGVGFLLTVVVKGVVWFAPQLIAFHGMDTVQAMRWSAYAAVSNLGALVTYALLLFLLFWAALLPAPYIFGLALVLPVMAISTFVGYRDVFEAVKAP
ncbi:MAG TPA: BPSS1780 family membrane protein [Usitatibacter sp.]|jgi:uncharacterized membrane protein|nr:BPSS1780 family membrane protein [Usitatibacter sp.]